MVEEAVILLLIDLLAWCFIAFWLFIWVGFLTSIVLARIWLSPDNKQLSSALMAAKSLVNSSVANTDTLIPASTIPGVSILKPLTGSDETLSHNLESWFKLRYPIFEILLCVHDVNDPAVPIVYALLEKYPGVDAKLVISGGTCDVSPRHVSSSSPAYKVPLSPTPSISLDDVEQQNIRPGSASSQVHYQTDLSTVINPKIRNILPAYESAKYDLLFISDCHIEAEPETLHDVVSLMGPRVGTVCQMHYVRDPPSNMLSFGSIVNKVFFGTQNAKAILFLTLLRITSTVSAAMLIRKSALDECGGLRAFGCYLAEDFHIGLALTKRGWTHKLGSRLAWQNPASITLTDVFTRVIRWKRLRQTTNPILFVVDPLTECFVLGLVASWALCHLLPTVPFWAVFLAHCLAWFFADFMLLSAINRGPLNFPKFVFLLAWLVRELSAPVVHVISVLSRRVVWRGQEYYVRFGGQTNRLPSPASSNPTDPLLAARRRATSLIFTPQLHLPVFEIEQNANDNDNGNDNNSSNNNKGRCCSEQPSPTISNYSSISNSSLPPSTNTNNHKSRRDHNKTRRHSQQASSPPSLCAVNA